MNSSTPAVIALLLLTASWASSAKPIQVVENPYYTSIMDCRGRVPLMVIYSLSTDKGHANRHPDYIDDEQLKKQAPDCHPTTFKAPKTYQAVATKLGVKEKFDVGHLAMSNHLDDSDESSRVANQFSNLAPQNAIKNRNGGAWYELELIVECHRDVEDLIVFVGTINDETDTSRDYFVDTFSQITPEHWWRLVYWKKSNMYKAWVMPNTGQATRINLLAGQFDADLVALSSLAPITKKATQNLKALGATEAPNEFIATSQQKGTLSCRGITTNLS